MTFARIDLESFENDDTGQPIQSAEYQRGFQAGLKAAKISSDTVKSDALEAIAATLSDMSFGFAEAREFVLNSLKPLLAQVSETVVPKILHDTFGTHLIDVILAEFETHSERPIEIAVSPEALTELSDIGAALTRCPIEFVSDTHLSAGLEA